MTEKNIRIAIVAALMTVALGLAITTGANQPAIDQPAWPQPAPAPFPLNEQGLPEEPKPVFLPRAEATPSAEVATVAAEPKGEVLGASSDQAIAIMSLVNAKRAEVGAPALNYNAQLANGAAGRAAYLLRTKRWSHAGYIAAIGRSGYKYVHCGENLAKEFDNNDATAIVNAWMSSPTHRANMLHPAWRDAGIGVAGDRVVMWFGFTK